MRRLPEALVLLAVLALVYAGSQVQAANGNGNGKGKGNAQARSVLVRVDKPMDADAKGKIDFHVRKGEYNLRIKAQKLTGITAVDFVLLDADGEPEEVIRSNVAVEVDGGEGCARIKLYSRDGDTFDGDSTEIGAALAGRLVGVRTAGDDDDDMDLLVGVIPDLAPGGQKKRNGKGREFDDDEKGQCRVEWRQKDGRFRLTIKARLGLAEGTRVRFKLVHAGGEFVMGSDEADKDGKVRLKLRTDHGDSLPLAHLQNAGLMSGATVRICYDPGTGEEIAAEDELPKF
jgi:hypothetical protein